MYFREFVFVQCYCQCQPKGPLSTWRPVRGHSDTQVLRLRFDTWAFGALERTRVIKAPRRQSTQGLRYLGTQGTQALGHSGTWALRVFEHSSHLVAQALGHSRHFIQQSRLQEIGTGKKKTSFYVGVLFFVFIIHLITQKITTFKIILDLINFISIFTSQNSHKIVKKTVSFIFFIN